MIDFDRLHELDYVKSNIKTIYEKYKLLEAAIELLKSEAKLTNQGYSNNGVTVSVSTSNKYIPTNLRELLRMYPVELNESMYNITLSKEAKNIVTEEGLLTTVPSTRVVIKVDKDGD